MHFQKQDLEAGRYHWEDKPGHSLFTGEPSRRLFDRFNGDQVLFLINFFASQSDEVTLQEAKEIEYEIFQDLPIEAKSEISVLNWIRNSRSRGKGQQEPVETRDRI